jgi:hypothetical protein
MIRIRLYVFFAICLVCMSRASHGQAITTITLAPLPTGTVAAGTVVPLAASVHDISGPVLAGQVTFWDGARILGSVPVVRVGTAGYTPGTATFRSIFGPGGHSLRATFAGTTTEQTSTSSSASLTVASSAASPVPGLIYSNSRYFNQITDLEKFILVDINNDGVLDLVAPQLQFGNVAISLGDPVHPGAFLPPTFVDAGNAVDGDGVVAGDLNGDGLPDLVVTDSDEGLAVILFQDPAHPGSFLPALDNGETVLGAQIADINHDGVLDLILFPPSASGVTINSSVSVLLGNPASPGTFLPAITTSLGDMDRRTAVVADMNGDGLPDIVLGNATKQTIAILLNDPSNPGHLLPRSDYVAGQPGSLAVADLNNDGVPDVVFGGRSLNGASEGVTVLLGIAAHPGQFGTPTTYPVSATPAGGESLGIAIGDVDGDGIPDIVSGNNGAVFDVLSGRGDGTFKPTIAYNTGPTPGTFEGVSMAVADVDGDGAADVLVGQLYQNDVQIFLHQASTPQRLITATDLVTVSTVHAGNPLTINISVTSAAGPPPGSVALYDNSNLIATLPLDASGSAVYTDPSPAIGFHNFLGYFPGDNLYSPSTGTVSGVVVIGGATIALTLGAAPNPANLGQAVTVTASATAIGASPTGTIVFLDGGTQIGSAPLSGGTAVFTTSSLIAGPHGIQAVYPGDSNYGAQTATVIELINYPPATVTIKSSVNPATAGQPVTFTFQIAATGPPATGQVIFQDNGSQIAAVPLSGTGSAVFTTSFLAIGTHTIAAIYSGDTNYVTQSASLAETINPPPSSTLLNAAPNPAFAGQSVTLTATVTGPALTPVGAVTFYDGPTLLGNRMLDITGHASLSVTTLSVGPHTLTAAYAGSSFAYFPSTSPPVTETILPNPEDFSLTLASPSLTIQTQHHLTTTVTLASINGFADSVAITCANLPAYVICRPTPAAATLAANGTATVSLYFDTDSIPGYVRRDSGPLRRDGSLINVALLLPFGLLAGVGAFPRRRFGGRSRVGLVVLAVAGVCLTLALSGCGSEILPFNIPQSTPPGTYTIPVTATGAATGVSHTANLTLTVTQ